MAGNLLAILAGLGAGAQTGVATNRQRTIDALTWAEQQQGQAAQRAELARQGIHFLQPGERAPYDAPLPTPQTIAENAGPASAKQGPTGLTMPAPTNTEPSDPMSSVLSSIPRYTPFQGGYIDNYESMRPGMVASLLAGVTEYQKKRAEIAADPSGPAQRNAEAYQAYRNANAPHLGDDTYAPAMGAVAGAQANARVAPAIRQAVGIAQGTEPIDFKKATDIFSAEMPGRVELEKIRAGMSTRAIAARAAQQTAEQAAQVLSQYGSINAAGRLFNKNVLGRYAMTPEGQNAQQAAEQFATAYLGRTGRNANPNSVQGLVNQILVQPGEEGNKTVVQNKARRVQAMLQEMRAMGLQTEDDGTPGADATTPPDTSGGAYHDLIPRP